jgi:dTDP-4-amino-4,6-dideoxygalactose transaminase
MTPDTPAVLGGPPAFPAGPPDWPPPDEGVRQALEACAQDGSWARYLGPHVEALETRLAGYHGVGHALAVGSGTYAVELALRALRVGPGHEVVLAGYDYPGNFLTVHALGAVPVLVDVHPDNWNLDPDRLEEALGPATRVVVVSHLHGGAVPMREVMALTRPRGVAVVEDACQCPGAWVQGRRAGTWGDAGVISFGGSKLLTAGRGGAVLTADDAAASRARAWHNRASGLCPLSELQAAVLLPQLDQLDARNTLRRARVRRLAELLHDVPALRLFPSFADSEPGYYKVGIQFDEGAFGLTRDVLLGALVAEGVAMAEGFKALHAGRSTSRYRAAGPLTESERAGHGTILLHHPVLLGEESGVEAVALAVHKVWQHREAIARRRGAC